MPMLLDNKITMSMCVNPKLRLAMLSDESYPN